MPFLPALNPNNRSVCLRSVPQCVMRVLCVCHACVCRACVCHACIRRSHSPIGGVVRARLVCSHHYKHVLEVGPYVLRGEGLSPGLLEYDGHYVIPYVTLPQELGNVDKLVRENSKGKLSR